MGETAQNAKSPQTIVMGCTFSPPRKYSITARSPAKAGAQMALLRVDPGFRRGTATCPKGIIANLFQGPWPALSRSAAFAGDSGHGC